MVNRTTIMLHCVSCPAGTWMLRCQRSCALTGARRARMRYRRPAAFSASSSGEQREARAEQTRQPAVHQVRNRAAAPPAQQHRRQQQQQQQEVRRSGSGKVAAGRGTRAAVAESCASCSGATRPERAAAGLPAVRLLANVARSNKHVELRTLFVAQSWFTQFMGGGRL